MTTPSQTPVARFSDLPCAMLVHVLKTLQAEVVRCLDGEREAVAGAMRA